MPPVSGPDVQVVTLPGEVDLGTCADLQNQLASALELRRPLLVDLGECTFIDVAALETLDAAFREARRLGLGFVVVVPYRAESMVGRLVLELLPDLARYALQPTRTRALHALGSVREPGPPVADRLEAIRARTWRLARESEELWAERDRLMLELKCTLAEARRALRAARGNAG